MRPYREPSAKSTIRPKNDSAGQSRRERVAPRSEIFLGFGKFEVASGQRPVVSFAAGIERVVGKFDTFGGALAIMGRPRQRVVHAASPEYAPSRRAKTYGTTIRAQDGKSSIESPSFTLPLFTGRHGRSAVSISSRANGAAAVSLPIFNHDVTSPVQAGWRAKKKKEAPSANS